ncbi:hypothetical protein Bca52824_092358 [Brassica carinata]|uniref:Uncharacterized protein n=1 Tax=Brassica carinata TaxID=52824 RepID=A0A8X7TFG5_BRACI|nr:hypothetical protein Bca52824_092358 [Brassica carinata]
MSSLSSTSLDLSSCWTPSELLGVVVEEAEEIDGGGVSREADRVAASDVASGASGGVCREAGGGTGGGVGG